MAALESVREHIGRLASESQVDKELGGTADDVVERRRLRAFRNEARTEAARAELDELKRELGRVSVEGAGRCDWVLIDGGDVIVHLFRPEVRAFYNLEKMWGSELPEPGRTAASA